MGPIKNIDLWRIKRWVGPTWNIYFNDLKVVTDTLIAQLTEKLKFI